MTRAEHRRQQIQRVDAYKAWLAAGSPLGSMPACPRNADFKAWREAQTTASAQPEPRLAQRHDPVAA